MKNASIIGTGVAILISLLTYIWVTAWSAQARVDATQDKTLDSITGLVRETNTKLDTLIGQYQQMNQQLRQR